MHIQSSREADALIDGGKTSPGAGRPKLLRAILVLLATTVVSNERRRPAQASSHVTEVSVLPFLFQVLDENPDGGGVSVLLELFWALLEPLEVQRCLQNVAVALLSGFRFSPCTPDLHHQKRHLSLFLSVVRHDSSRRYLLENVLYPPPNLWPTQLESLQLRILEQLTTDDDAPQGQTSRDTFLAKFEDFIKENSPGSRTVTLDLCPPSVALNFFHRLVALLRQCLPVLYAASGKLLQAHSHKASVELSSGTPNAFDKDRASTKVFRLLDGIVRLYYLCSHAHFLKMNAVREGMRDYLRAVQEVRRNSALGEPDVVEALTKAEEVFSDTLVSAGQAGGVALRRRLLKDPSWNTSYLGIGSIDVDRHCAAGMQIRHLSRRQSAPDPTLSQEKQADVYWLLRVVLLTLEEASHSGAAFAFVPDYYVESCIKLLTSLSFYFPPTCNLSDIPGHYNVLVRYSTFLAQHFADPRVTNPDMKDALLRALAAHVCPPSTVRALECMPTESSMAMIQALLQPYKNRPWAQTELDPHEALEAPCPSVFFQNHIGRWLEDHPDRAAAFLGSVLTQLNWAFSQFISMLQEIQNAHFRPERVFVDTRQLKICATCFDLSLGLLRLVSQVLNRVTSRCGCFDLVVGMDVAGLEAVDHFPIVAAVTGILVALLLRGSVDSRENALSVLLAEPSFQQSSLEFLLGGGSNGAASLDSAVPSPPLFSLAKLADAEVKEEEVEQVRQLVQLVQGRQAPATPLDEDQLCTICYAQGNSVRFVPCGHQSCQCKATDTAQQSPMLVQRQNNSTEPLESVNNVTTQEVPIHLDSGWNSTSLAYVFVPLGLVVCLGLAAALVVFLVRKSRLDRLRHHLMPFYSFDPQDEGEDWEAELLEEGLTHRPNPANK
ncbi:hypothetical protein HPB47_015653, partial [Ixodes persulcatus]